MSNMKDMPAFPCGRDVTLDQYAPSSGMTLRDYFAAKAMQLCFDHCTTNENAAREAYKAADAMLEARK